MKNYYIILLILLIIVTACKKEQNKKKLNPFEGKLKTLIDDRIGTADERPIFYFIYDTTTSNLSVIEYNYDTTSTIRDTFAIVQYDNSGNIFYSNNCKIKTNGKQIVS